MLETGFAVTQGPPFLRLAKGLVALAMKWHLNMGCVLRLKMVAKNKDEGGRCVFLMFLKVVMGSS